MFHIQTKNTIFVTNYGKVYSCGRNDNKKQTETY